MVCNQVKEKRVLNEAITFEEIVIFIIKWTTVEKLLAVKMQFFNSNFLKLFNSYNS